MDRAVLPSPKFVWIDGELRRRDEAGLDPFELGLLQGLGVFETLWAGPGQAPWEVGRHHARLGRDCRLLDLELPALAELIAAGEAVRAANELDQEPTRLRWTLTRPDWESQRLLVSASPVGTGAGAAAVAVSGLRRHRRDPVMGVKTTSYAGLASALWRARSEGFDEALYGNEAGELVEGMTSNVFLVREGELWTPPLASGCLPGVTREVVLELAPSEPAGGWRVREEVIELEALATFEAGFLTNTQVGIRPIERLGERRFAGFDERLESLRRSLARARGG